MLKGGFETVLPKKEKSNYARLPPFPITLVQKKKFHPANSRLRKSYYSRVLATSVFFSRAVKSPSVKGWDVFAKNQGPKKELL